MNKKMEFIRRFFFFLLLLLSYDTYLSQGELCSDVKIPATYAAWSIASMFLSA